MNKGTNYWIKETNQVIHYNLIHWCHYSPSAFGHHFPSRAPSNDEGVRLNAFISYIRFIKSVTLTYLFLICSCLPPRQNTKSKRRDMASTYPIVRRSCNTSPNHLSRQPRPEQARNNHMSPGKKHCKPHVYPWRITQIALTSWSPCVGPVLFIFQKQLRHTIWKYNEVYVYINQLINYHLSILHFYSDVLSGILSGKYFAILSGILSGIYSDILSGIYSEILSGIFSGVLSDILSGVWLRSGSAQWALEFAVEGWARSCRRRRRRRRKQFW